MRKATQISQALKYEARTTRLNQQLIIPQTTGMNNRKTCPPKSISLNNKYGQNEIDNYHSENQDVMTAAIQDIDIEGEMIRYTSGSSLESRYTAESSGYFFASTTISFENGAGTDDTMMLTFWKNGTPLDISIYINPYYHAVGGAQSQTLSGIIEMDEDDYIDVHISNVHTVNLDAIDRHFSVFKIADK